MSFLEIGLGIGLITVVLVSVLWITALTATSRSLRAKIEDLSKEISNKESAARELRESVRSHMESAAELMSKLAACESKIENLDEELSVRESKIEELNDRIARYRTIDDAENYAGRIRDEAHRKVSELKQAADAQKTEALSVKEQVLKLKSQRDQLSNQIKGYQLFKNGCDTIDKLKSAIAEEKLNHQTLLREHEDAATKKANDLKDQIVSLEEEIKAKRESLNVIEDTAEMQSFGIYHPQFDFDHSDEYREALKATKQNQKQMVRDKIACVCNTNWSVDGDERKGQQMTDRNIKLMLRAVNGECDGIIAKVSYKNVESSEKRIRKAFEVIGKLGETNNISFSPQYLMLKLRELYLDYEHSVKKQEEKELERERKEAIREEEKAEKEIKKAQAAAEKEESMKAAALEAAKKDLADQHGKHNAKLASLVQKLENELADAIDRKSKAIARAQLTKSGHVYILSNVGTMGDGVFKIGMTRRLEPLDRVKELGDASVPFPFDVHAMIYTENAPELENALHKKFADRRVNLVNLRREFFEVSLDEIREAVAELYGLYTFRLEPEAEQYRTSLGLKEEAAQAAAG